MYKIKPFEWKRCNNGHSIVYVTHTPFGSYRCIKIIDKEDKTDLWMWEYCFDEYYDEEHSQYEFTLKQAKQKCWLHWVDRIEKALIPCE